MGIEAYFLDRVQELVIGLTKEYFISYINSFAATYYGWNKKQVIGENFIELCKLKKHKYPSILSNLQCFAKDMTEIVYENGGVLRWSMVCEESEDNRLKFMLFGRDITEQRRWQVESLNIQKRINAIINALPGNYWWKDRESKYMACNENILKMANVASSDFLIGKTDYDLPWRRQADMLIANDKKAMRSGQVLEMEERVTVFNGNRMELLVMKAPLYDANNHIIGTVGTAINLAEKKQLQGGLIRQIEQMEKIYSARAEITANIGFNYQGLNEGMYELMGRLSGRSATTTVGLPLRNAANKILKDESIFMTNSKKKVGASKNVLMRVLLVEDNQIAARSAKKILQKFNCVVDVAVSAQQALDCLSENNYQVIFMDIGLPDQSGFAVARAIRLLTDKIKASTPIVALTGHFGDKHKADCIAAGMDDMLSKPLQEEQVQAVVGSWLKIKDAGTAEQQLSVSSIEGDEALVIDLALGAEIVGSEKQAKKMLAFLAESLPDDLKVIDCAFQDSDYSALYNAVHKLHGGLCYCGVPQLRAVTKELHTLLEAKTKDHARITELYNKLTKAANDFQQALAIS